jgi:hypothetical protein
MVEKIGQIMGRHSIHKKPMTATEYQRRWRAKKRRKAIWSGGDDATARRPTPKRTDKDFWPTPTELQRALVRYVLPLLPVGLVWEPAAGDGALADALAESGRDLVLSDIDPQRSGILRRDFLKDDPPAGTKGSILITNPPFIEEVFNGFCDLALQMLDTGHLQAVVLLARADKLGAQGRAKMLNLRKVSGCPPRPGGLFLDLRSPPAHPCRSIQPDTAFPEGLSGVFPRVGRARGGGTTRHESLISTGSPASRMGIG